jgi:tetratricopeptide (TPR) repeat protein
MDRQPLRRLPRLLLARFYHLRGMAHRHLGHLQNDLEEYRMAVADFGRAIQLHPGFAQALFDRGLLLWRELADGARAEEDLTRVLGLDPHRADAWFNRAFARQMTGDTEGAIADFQHYLAEGDDPMWREICERQLDALQTLPVPTGRTGA